MISAIQFYRPYDVTNYGEVEFEVMVLGRMRATFFGVPIPLWLGRLLRAVGY